MMNQSGVRKLLRAVCCLGQKCGYNPENEGIWIIPDPSWEERERALHANACPHGVLTIDEMGLDGRFPVLLVIPDCPDTSQLQMELPNVNGANQ